MYQLRLTCLDAGGAPVPLTSVGVYLADGSTAATLLDLDNAARSHFFMTDASGVIEFRIETLTDLTYRTIRGTVTGPVLPLFSSPGGPPVVIEIHPWLEGVADEAITAGQLVVGPLAAVAKADANTLAHRGALLGISATTSAIGDLVRVIPPGQFFSNTGWAFTEGSPVFLDADGGLTQDPTGLHLLYQVGVAVSATRILLNFGLAVWRP